MNGSGSTSPPAEVPAALKHLLTGKVRLWTLVLRTVFRNPVLGIRYGKHFLLLSASAGALLLIDAAHLFDRPAPTLAVYGVLHAAAVVFSLQAPASLARKFLFIGMSACLSVLTLYVVLVGRPVMAGVVGNAGPYLLLGFSSLLGALTYVSLIRLMWIRSLTFGWMAAIAGMCVLAILAAYFALLHFPLLGRWCLAVAWWCAMSGGLLLCELNCGPPLSSASTLMQRALRRSDVFRP